MGASEPAGHFESWTFAGLPGKTLHVILFTHVTNCKELQSKVKAGEVEPELAMLNAAVVADLFVVRIAAQQALAQQQRGKLITKSLHAELVYNMSGSRHISESFNRFGVSESCQHLLVARFDAEPTQLEAITDLVKGQQQPLSSLQTFTDKALIQKYYKVSPNELKVGTMADAALFKIAARDC
ncbi:hypothetical protein ABBQ38_008397 [Trebouxia sp. C0009 RCD-2024]